jgi:zinc and cadmium transporter
VAFSILGGIFGFFVLEKLLLYRHCHTENCEVHDPHPQPMAAHHDHGRSGALIVVGDTVHNFVDGVLIAAAFLQSTELGVVTAVAIIAHEIPQEVGDFLILLHSGYSRLRALAMNLLSSTATLVGGVIGYYALQFFDGLEPILLGVVAASMIYVAVADLIPGLHRRPELRDTAFQALLIALGIGTIALVGALLPH